MFIQAEKGKRMLCGGETTFTRKEITDILTAENFSPGTPEFLEAVRQRFVPTDTQNERGEDLYIES